MDAWIVATLRLAGACQVLVALANLPAVRLLDYRGNLAGTSLVFRHVFWSHAAWVVLSILGFAAADLAFPHALAGAHPLGRALSAFLALAWSLRLLAQVLLYDRAFRRAHRLGDVGFVTLFLFLAAVHAVAAVAAPLAP